MRVLNRVDQRNRTALVTQIVGDKTLPDDVVGQIVEPADRVPAQSLTFGCSCVSSLLRI